MSYGGLDPVASVAPSPCARSVNVENHYQIDASGDPRATRAGPINGLRRHSILRRRADARGPSMLRITIRSTQVASMAPSQCATRDGPSDAGRAERRGTGRHSILWRRANVRGLLMLRITIRSTQVAILWGRQDGAQGSMPHPATPPGGHTAHSNPSRYVFFPPGPSQRPL